MRQVRRAAVGALSALVLLAMVLLLTATTVLPGVARRYYLLLPGAVFPVAPAVQLPPERRQETGDLLYAIVYEAEATLSEALLAAARPGVRVVPYEEVIPAEVTTDESNQLNRRLMAESQTAAAVVALRAAGYPVAVNGQGVRIVEVVPGRPAAATLRPGDVIVAQDGEPVGLAAELIEGIRRRRPGDEVALTVLRDGARVDLRVGTVPSPGDPIRPAVGALVETVGFQTDLPFPVSVRSGDVIGPSAGLLFALGIYDALTPGRLGDGHKVAGTGTIGIDGEVGPVDGAAQKAIAAEQAGAELFLTPVENAAEARRAAASMRVVPVRTFAEALAAVDGLRAKD